MITRKLQSPGVEINEIDRSNYNKVDYSLPNSPTSLIFGFASRGEDSTFNWINSQATLNETYGQPTTEFEAYFYNAAMEILNRGGTCIASKLPYDNNSYEKINYVEYKIENKIDCSLSSNSFYSLYLNDTYLNSYIPITVNQYRKDTLENFDNFVTTSKQSLQNTIRIYDITKYQYKKLNSTADLVQTRISADTYINTNDCLGIIPIIVTAANALFFQNLLSYDSTIDYSIFNQVNSFDTITPNANIRLNFNNFDDYTCIPLASLPFDEEDESSGSNNESLSRLASLQFPSINFDAYNHFDSAYLKHIGVVVLKAYKDLDNNGKINYQLLESFVGSLDKSAKDEITHENIFIDNIINSQSKYIRCFSNVDKNKIDTTSIFVMSKQKAISIGFYEDDTKKNISYNRSILQPLTYLMDNASNKNTMPIDIIIDAGMSNIANLAKTSSNETLNTDVKPKFSDYELKHITNISDVIGWQTLIKRFDNLCKNIRKDCMFIADGLRQFCLDGDSKYIRKSAPQNTISNSILPTLRFMTNVINSSYSAGYCNWFYQQDYSKAYDYIWCPPSIKAAGVYIFCDTYAHPWSAPAGMARGVIQDAIDVAFIPLEDDAGKIYSNEWNYAMSYPLDGIIIEGHKTFQMQKTALDRINVRRLLLWLEKQVERVARRFVYEGNTPYLRQTFVDTIRPIFESAVSGDGLLEYGIKCDDELNTTQVIENNELRCKIAVKPVKVVDWIVIDLISTRQSASISEELIK